MFNHLKKILAKTGKKPAEHTPSNKLDQTRIASAVILLEAAHCDDECSKEELSHISTTIQSTFDLSPECATELIDLASTTRESEVDLWQFTNHINKTFSHDEKMTIIESVWHIVLLDGCLEQHEDHFAHKLANLLRLTHKELIDAKMTVKNKL